MINKKVDIAIWSIGVFKTTKFPVSLPKKFEPSLTAKDVTDISADFVADPFLFKKDSDYYLFFEVLNKKTEKGEIGLATSDDGKSWKYERIVLKEKFHLSYPYVFSVGNDIFMIPETFEANGVFLYKAINFPSEWEQVTQLAHGRFVDPSVFYFNKKWWMFVGTKNNANLHLFYSDNIASDWREHSLSPVVKNNTKNSRPAGRVIVKGNDIYRFSQDCLSIYGKLVRSFKINSLSENKYSEEEVNVYLNPSNKKDDWRKDGMHHVDQVMIDNNDWLVAVDGHYFKEDNYYLWKIKRALRNPFLIYSKFLNRKFNNYY